MKIQPISEYSYKNNVYKKSNSVNNSQYRGDTNNVVNFPNVYHGKDLVKTQTLSFTGTGGLSKAVTDMALQIPVGDRIAHVMSNIKLGDVVLLGSDFNKAQTALRKFADKLSLPIKREFYLPDRKLKNNYAFFKHPDGDRHILNINDDVLFIRANGTHYSLEPGLSSSIQNGNLIQFLDAEKNLSEHFHIVDKPKTNLAKLESFFSTVYDYSKDIEGRVKKLNYETLSKEIQQAKGAPLKIDFSRIGGQAKAIEELKKGILYPVKYPAAYSADDITRGFILYGPPGTGKTEISRALANEAGINYMYMSGTEFENKYVGESLYLCIVN